MVALSFYGIFGKWVNLFKIFCYKFSATISFALLPSSVFNLHIYFRLFCQTGIIEMPSLIRKEKITCGNCGAQTTRNKIVLHEQRSSVRTLFVPNVSISPHNHKLICITILLRSTALQNLMSSSIVNLCYQEFPLYVNTETRNTQRR